MGPQNITHINDKHEVWKDSLGVEILSCEAARQELDYIHFNPLKRNGN